MQAALPRGLYDPAHPMVPEIPVTDWDAYVKPVADLNW